RAPELLVAHPLAADAVELGADHLEGAGDVVLTRADVDPHLARVRVLARPRVDRVREAALLADLLEEPRGSGAADDRIEDRERETPVVVARDARSAQADVVLLGLLR